MFVKEFQIADVALCTTYDEHLLVFIIKKIDRIDAVFGLTTGG